MSACVRALEYQQAFLTWKKNNARLAEKNGWVLEQRAQRILRHLRKWRIFILQIIRSADIYIYIRVYYTEKREKCWTDHG